MSKHPAFRQILSDPFNFMNPIKIIQMVAIAVVFVGCSSTAKQTNGEVQPKHMKRVKVAQFDQAQRQMSPKVEFLFQPPPQKFKVIALITCEGAYHEEAVMTEAMIYKARQLGADAVLAISPNELVEDGRVAPVIMGYGAGGAGGSAGERKLYKLTAIVFDKK